MNEDLNPRPAPSIGLAIEQGWAVMRRILFEPFDIGKWFVLGFSAWLATLGEGGGSGGGGGGNPSTGGGNTAGLDGVVSFIQQYLAIIITVVAVVVTLLVIIGLLVLWVRSRGKFMFLDNVARNRAEIVLPWQTYRMEGNALFLWSAVFSFLALVAFLVIVGVGLLVAWPSIIGRSFGPDAVMALVVFIPLLLVYLLVVTTIHVLLNDFVVPVMYTRRSGAIAGWRTFLGIFRPWFWHFVLYLLTRFALNLVAGIAILALVLLTCCIAGCIMIIPYIGTVFLLPVIVFFRALSLCYLRQFGPPFDVFPHPPNLPMPTAAEEDDLPKVDGPGLAGDGI